jgi:hypothetical protein
MSFQPVSAGSFVAKAVKVKGGSGLDVEGAGGALLGSIRPTVNAQQAVGVGVGLEAADGSWFIAHLQDPRDPHRPVLDASGTEVAAIEKGAKRERVLRLPNGELTWKQHTGRPQYRIEGCFSANRSALHSFVAGVSRKPFTGELTDTLAARPDASLAVLLACWLTNAMIESKVAASSSD